MTGAGMRILVVNAGSTSLKLAVIGADDEIVNSWDSWPGATAIGEIDAAVHRFVHGGTSFRRPIIIDADVERRLVELTDLAPLHQPKALEALRQVRTAFPDVAQVGCFDTAFHATLAPAAFTYALPAEWTAKYGLRRYGFHGISHEWASIQAVRHVPRARRIVICHLGGGASLCAVLDGKSVDTTMGFTPAEGLVMATRSGDVDPGLLGWLSVREPHLYDDLERRSGLLGLAGTDDMRELLSRADHAATLAVDVYLHRLRKNIAAMAASLGGLDACVFTGGVGENSPEIRRRAVAELGFLGLEIDDNLNVAATADGDVSTASAMARTLVVAAREDLEMAAQARETLSPAGPS